MKANKYINASYQLYDVTDGKKELLEETSEERPFVFISGLGILLDAFEHQVVDLETGSSFDFTLTPEQAYGEYTDENLIELDKEIFCVDGQFDAKNVFQDAVIPLQSEDGKRFNGRVDEVTADKVRVDMNHPLAGRTLNFIGTIVENREATNDELSHFVEHITGQQNEDGCCCSGGCDCKNKDKEGEGCEKHHDGQCCGKHHHE